MLDTTISQFPDENIDPREKAKAEFLLKYAKAALYSYNKLPEGAIGRRSKVRYDKYKAYAMGRQDISVYKRIFNSGDDNASNLLVTDWSVMPIIPKFRRVALGILGKTEYDIQINPIDPLAKSEVDDIIIKNKAKIAVKNAMMQNPETAQIAANSPLLMTTPEEAEDFDGIQVMELGIRHKTAMEVEQIREVVFNGNNFPDIRRQYHEDLFDYGVCFVKDETQGDCINVRRCDPRAMVINFCQYSDFSDWKFIGEIMTMPVSQLIAMSQDNPDIKEADIEQFYRKSSNIEKYNTYMDFVASGTIEVLDLELRSIDVAYYEERVNSAGNTVYGKVDPKKAKNGKYTKKKVENIYKVKWVLGTDCVFDYGKKEMMKRNPLQKQLVKSSFHIAACDLFEMRTRSRTEELITYADAIQVARYKLQHTLNTVVPQGYFINYEALESVSLSAGGHKITPKEILDLFFQRGILLGRYTTIDGEAKAQKAVEPLIGGVGNEIAEHWNIIMNNIDMMRQSLGLNEITDGSTPNPKTLSKIAEAAQMGTNNALSDMFEADKRINKMVTESVIIRAQAIVQFGNPDMFINALGSVQTFKTIKDIYKYIYSVEIVENPSQDDLIALQQQIQMAQQSGQITISNVLMLSNIKNMKMKQLYLAYCVKKNADKAQQDAMAAQENNGKIQVQSAQMAEQAKQQTIQMEYDLKMKYEAAVKDLELRNLEISKQYDLERERIAASGRVESSFVQAKERDASNIRNNTTALIKENKDDKKDIIDIPTELKSTVEPQTQGGEELNVKPTFEFYPKGEVPNASMVEQMPQSPEEEQQEPVQEPPMEEQQEPMAEQQAPEAQENMGETPESLMQQ